MANLIAPCRLSSCVFVYHTVLLWSFYVTGAGVSNVLLCALYLLKGSLETVERFAFYERAKKAFAVVATG